MKKHSQGSGGSRFWSGKEEYGRTILGRPWNPDLCCQEIMLIKRPRPWPISVKIKLIFCSSCTANINWFLTFLRTNYLLNAAINLRSCLNSNFDFMTRRNFILKIFFWEWIRKILETEICAIFHPLPLSDFSSSKNTSVRFFLPSIELVQLLNGLEKGCNAIF